MTVLYKLNYSLLDELCNYLHENEGDQELQRIDSYCQDYKFWVGYLYYLGYDLPKGLAKLLEIIRLRSGREDIVETLRYMFFSGFYRGINPSEYFRDYWHIYSKDQTHCQNIIDKG